MGFFAFLNQWWNLPFLVMLGLVAVFFVLQIVGLVGHDADHDGGGGGDHDADADADADGAPHGSDGGFGWHDALAFFGVGRVPFMVVWVTLCLFGGFAGVFLNRVLYVRAGGQYRGWWIVPVLLSALVIALAAVRLFARLASRFVDVGGRGATAKHELVGHVGVVASAVVDHRFGELRVRDARGNEQLVHGRLQGDEAPLPRDAKVVIVDWDAAAELFWVTECPDVDTQQGA